MRHVVLNLVSGPIDGVGMWCDVCALPSVVGYGIYHLTENGVSLVASVTGCVQCFEREQMA